MPCCTHYHFDDDPLANAESNYPRYPQQCGGAPFGGGSCETIGSLTVAPTSHGLLAFSIPDFDAAQCRVHGHAAKWRYGRPVLVRLTLRHAVRRLDAHVS